MRHVAKALVVTALTMAVWLYLVRHAGRIENPLGGCRISYVYDGDTVALSCVSGRELTARIVGLDAPETTDPRCAAELAHGTLATERLRALIAMNEARIERRGTDRYGRVLIRLRLAGEDVAQRMVREGLAVEYAGGRRIDWCARLGG